jgi:hypothetical protein
MIEIIKIEILILCLYFNIFNNFNITFNLSMYNNKNHECTNYIITN